MMMSGSLSSEMEFEPRMRMRVPAPSVPPSDCATTPGVRDVSSSEKLFTGARLTESISIVPIDTGCSRFVSDAPVALMTISSSFDGVEVSAKSAVTVPLAGTVTLCVAAL
jgi:hypothetical protein